MSFSVMLQQLSSGMVKSLGIFVLTLVFSLPLGLLVSFGRMSRNRLLQGITKIYISIMRSTPLSVRRTAARMSRSTAAASTRPC